MFQAYDFLKEDVTAIIMFYKDMKTMVHSPGGDTDFFDIITGVMQRDSLTPFLFIICLDYALRTSIDERKWLHTKQKKAKSRRYPVETIAYTDYAENLTLLTKTSSQAESQLHSLEQTARGIGIYVNSGKTEFICFSQDGTVSSLNG